MKRFVILAVAMSLAVGAMALAAKPGKDKKGAASAPASAPTTKASAKPVNKFCPLEPENAIDPKGKTVTYKGKVIGFCCEDCIKPFEKDPEKYMKDLK